MSSYVPPDVDNMWGAGGLRPERFSLLPSHPGNEEWALTYEYLSLETLLFILSVWKSPFFYLLSLRTLTFLNV